MADKKQEETGWLAKYSSSVEELETETQARRDRYDEENDAETLLPGFAGGSQAASDAYDEVKQHNKEVAERNKEIDEQNKAAEEYNREHAEEIAAAKEQNARIKAENDAIDQRNKEREKKNKEIADRNKKHAARGEPLEPYEEYEEHIPYVDVNEKPILEHESEEEYRALDIFKAAESNAEARAQQITADLLVNGQTIGTWVEFWEAIDKTFPKIMETIDSVKKKLLAAVDLIETLVDSVKKFVNILYALIGSALQMASLAILLAKAIVASLKAVLEQIMKVMQIALLKSELKVAPFWLWDKIAYNKKDGVRPGLQRIDRMRPYVSKAVEEACSTWFNRPTAYDELCIMLLLPAAFSAATAQFLGKSARLADQLNFNTRIGALFDTNKTKNAAAYSELDISALDLALEDMTNRYGWAMNRLAQNIAERANSALIAEIDADCEALMPTVDMVAKSVNSSLGAKISGLYNDMTANELESVTQAAATMPCRLSGVLNDVTARISGDKVEVELNFATDRSCYISEIYLVSKDGSSVKNVFRDPSFTFARVLCVGGFDEYFRRMISLFNTAVVWWTSRRLKRTAKEKLLEKAIETKILDPVFGKGLFDKCCSKYPLWVSSDYELYIAALKEGMKSSNFQTALSAYDQKKQNDLVYQARNVINPRVPRLRPTVMLDSGKAGGVSEGQSLIFALVSDRAKYFDHSFLNKGGTRDAYYYAAMTPGDLAVNLDTMYVKVTVHEEGYELIRPRWYGIGTPPGVSDWTLSWLLTQIPGVSEYIGDPLKQLDRLTEFLDAAQGQIDTIKSKVDAMMATFDRYYALIKEFLDALRKFLMAFGLPNFPSIYVATWKGGIQDVPGIVMNALQEAGIDNSTYGGYIVFGSVASASAFTELYKSHVLTKAEIEATRKKAVQFNAEIEAEQTAMADTASEIGEIDWVGYEAYKQKVEAEEDAKVKAENDARKAMLEASRSVHDSIKEIADGLFVINVEGYGKAIKPDYVETVDEEQIHIIVNPAKFEPLE